VKIRDGPAAVSEDEIPLQCHWSQKVCFYTETGKAWESRTIRKSEDRLHGLKRDLPFGRKGKEVMPLRVL